MTPRPEMEAALEAVLFVSSDPVPRGRLLEMFDEEEREAAAEALDAVVARFSEAPERGVQVEEVAGGVRLVTRPDMNGWLRRFFEVTGSSKLSMAALETLAVIAYRQPVTGPEIQELRSVSSSGVLKTLLEKRMIRIAGRKEVVGRPFLYTTTREFLVHFGLKSLKDLPPLEELEESFEDGAGDTLELPPEPGLAAGGGDREETILRQAAAIDERREEEDGGEEEHGGEEHDTAAGPASRPRRRGPVGLVPAPMAAAPPSAVPEAGPGAAEAAGADVAAAEGEPVESGARDHE